MLQVRSVAVNDWQEYRGIRLRALLDSPDAFGSTYEAEVVRTDEQWQARIAAASISANDRVLFAMYHERVCGLTWCKLSA